jgi:hypothetical protein
MIEVVDLVQDAEVDHLVLQPVEQVHRVLPAHQGSVHRLNQGGWVKYGERSTKFIWAPVYSCTHFQRHRNLPPPHPAFGLIYEGAIGHQGRRHLFVTPWFSPSKCIMFSNAGDTMPRETHLACIICVIYGKHIKKSAQLCTELIICDYC